MTTMVAELYDALREAGASEPSARRAAEVVADYDRQFGGIHTDLAGIKTELGGMKGRLDGMKGRLDGMEGRLTGVEGRLTMLMWVIGLNFAATLAILAKIALH